MIRDAVKKQGRSISGWIAPYLVLALMLAASVWLWRFWANVETTREQIYFAEYCERISQDIAGRTDTHMSILQSGVAILIASESITREKWRSYYEYLQVQIQHLDIQDIGFAEVITPVELARHMERIRAEGFPEYAVWPDGERDIYTPIVFLEPFDVRNQQVFGFDMFSEPVRRAAMELARDTATAVMSGRVHLVQEPGKDVQAGFLLYVPVFAGGLPLTVEARRTAITAYVYGTLRVKDLMRSIFEETPEKVAFELYDGARVVPEALLFDSRELDGGSGKEHRARFSSHTPLELYGHTWSLVFHSTPQFDADKEPHLSWIILSAGLAFSIAFFLLMLSQSSIVVKAEMLAAELTMDLRESEQHLNHLNTISPAVVYTLAPADFSLIWVSPNVTALTGYTLEEALQSGWWEGHLHPEDRERVLARSAVVDTWRTVHEYRFQRKDKEFVWIFDELRLLRDDQGQPVEIVGSWLDITARKRAAEEASRMVTVVRDSNDAITIQDSEGRITAWNRGAERMYGDTEAEALQMSIERLTASGKVEEQKDFTRRLLAGEAITSLETRRVTKDGRVLNVWMTVTKLVDDAGKSIGIASTERDITERKRAEESLRKLNAELEQRVEERTRELVLAKEAVEQAYRAKSVFLANMSHEIRTPLNAVLGFAQILERDGSLTPRQSGMLHTIARSGRHLLNLINDILDMSKIEAGRLKLSSKDFCFYDLLDDVEMMFRSHAQAKQLQLLMERDGSAPRYVSADEGKLRQVLINLMGNAVKFTRTGGVTVRVRAETVVGSSVGDANAVRLVVEVEDSGPGIVEDELDRIFEPFRQSAANKEAGGTGLGLALSRRIVELMGGSLTVKSQVGKGACFCFDVLVMPAEEAAQAKEQEAWEVVGLEPGTGTFRILIVDDQKDNRDLLAALLAPLDFEIREVANGQEALDVFEAWSPHAVLMDMRMPVMDGYEATRRIKATEQGRTTPVIAVTASASDDTESKVLAMGMDGYVRKPLRTEEFFAVLGKCLGLRYVYAETAGQATEKADVQPLTREDLAALPRALRKAMCQAVDEGDMAGLQSLIARVEETDASAARKLRNLADQYDYETLTQILINQNAAEGELDE
jgi:PAS domain S-box-containing protein